jgi:aryl-alcohol dehydrogenase-like predicted oxidoreductase
VNNLRLAGVEVPRIGLGTNRLTPEHTDFIRAAIDAGVRHIDTARLYQGGASEQAIGAANVPDEVLVATKGGWNDGSPENLHAEIEQSLKALDTDAIGLYYLHKIHPGTPLEDSFGAIKEHVQKGNIRSVGISNATLEQIEVARSIVDIAAVQNHYNQAERGDDDLIDQLAADGTVYVPFYPLKGGEGSNADKLRWLLERSPNVLPIPGTLNIEHLRENLSLVR